MKGTASLEKRIDELKLIAANAESSAGESQAQISQLEADSKEYLRVASAANAELKELRQQKDVADRELKLGEDVRSLRVLADNINQKSMELSKLLAEFQNRSRAIAASGLKTYFKIEIVATPNRVPSIVHSEGSERFVIRAFNDYQV